METSQEMISENYKSRNNGCQVDLEDNSMQQFDLLADTGGNKNKSLDIGVSIIPTISTPNNIEIFKSKK